MDEDFGGYIGEQQVQGRVPLFRGGKPPVGCSFRRILTNAPTTRIACPHSLFLREVAQTLHIATQVVLRAPQAFDDPGSMRQVMEHRIRVVPGEGKRTEARAPFQLHPWLVPHWVQTPQAPARMTLSEPQLEQMTPM